MNILVVDDKKTVQHMLTELLYSQGHSVDTANNGLDALSKVQKDNYQLFVIDHLMPVMDGIQLIKNLKTMPDFLDTKVIFMTTQGGSSLKSLPEFTLFDKIIEKPFNEESFLSALSEVTDENFACEILEVNS
ncbi:MAG: response regulator [Colwellia sp.]